MLLKFLVSQGAVAAVQGAAPAGNYYRGSASAPSVISVFNQTPVGRWNGVDVVHNGRGGDVKASAGLSKYDSGYPSRGQGPD